MLVCTMIYVPLFSGHRQNTDTGNVRTIRVPIFFGLYPQLHIDSVLQFEIGYIYGGGLLTFLSIFLFWSHDGKRI